MDFRPPIGLATDSWDQVKEKRKPGHRNGVSIGGHYAAEFAAETPYYYSSYGVENEISPSDKKKIMIIAVGLTDRSRHRV